MSISLERKTVLRAVFEAVAQVRATKGRPYKIPENLDPSTRLEELGIDSISIAEVVDVLEQRFELELPFDRLMLVESLDEFIDVVCGPKEETI